MPQMDAVVACAHGQNRAPAQTGRGTAGAVCPGQRKQPLLEHGERMAVYGLQATET